MITFIVGKRSNLSDELSKKIYNSKIISSEEFKNLKLKSKSNLIINNFFPSSKISKIRNYNEFINLSLSNLAKALDKIDKKKINKIIYSSSSSVYGYSRASNQKDEINRNLYSTTKILAESIISNYCNKNNLNFFIARLFNLYGSNDKFSIVSKLIDSYKNKSIFYLNNEGSAVRDFISYSQASAIYKKMLNYTGSGIVDVGTGEGIQIRDMINYLGYGNFKTKTRRISEISFSVAEKNKFNKKLRSNNLTNFLKKKLNIKKKVIFKIYKVNKNYIFNNFIHKTIIYGAGNAGRQLNQILSEKNPESVYCFVDDKKSIQNQIIDNKKVIGFDELKKIAKENTISNVIISIPSLKLKTLRKKIDKLNSMALSVNYLSLKQNLSSNKITIDDIQYSQLMNLLDRNITKPKSNLSKFLKNKTILVTGSAGSIGTAICNQLNKINVKKIIALDKSEMGIYNMKKNFYGKKFEFVLGDINNEAQLKYINKKYKINFIFHTAAYKHLNILENNIYEAVKNNIFGTFNIIKNFTNQNIIIISTDKAAKPKSILGLTKRISEIISLSYKNTNSKINVVRFGNVFASQGSAINLFLNQINTGGPITLTNKNVKRYFMSSNEAANLVIQGSTLSLNNEILVLKMGKQIKLIEIINKLLEIKKERNPFSEIKIKEIGLGKGEKMEERLFINKSKKIKGQKDIFIANEPKYNLQSIKNLIENLDRHLNHYDEKKLILKMRVFLKKEI